MAIKKRVKKIAISFPIEWRIWTNAEEKRECGNVFVAQYELSIVAPFIPSVGLVFLCPDGGEYKVAAVELQLEGVPHLFVDAISVGGVPTIEHMKKYAKSWKAVE